MSNQNFFVNKFLYFLDKNTEDFFHDSLIYIFEHDQNGALGIIINKTIDIGEDKIFNSLNIESLKNKSQKNLLNGGPVDIDKLFIIHNSDDKESLCVKNGLNLTSSMNVVKNIASGKFKGKYKLAIGYCGWDSGQLEEEIANNSWFVIEHAPNFVFELNVEEIIPYLSKELGYDLRQILNSKDTTKH